jgi:hypothetical protein
VAASRPPGREKKRAVPMITATARIREAALLFIPFRISSVL